MQNEIANAPVDPKADELRRQAAVQAAFDQGGFDPRYYQCHRGIVTMRPFSEWPK